MTVPVEAEFPELGAWRIHPNPSALPSRPGPDEAPPNRFDDPEGVYRVRYLATTRRGAFLEVLSRFRRHRETDERLAAVENVDDERTRVGAIVPGVVLASLRQARCLIVPSARFVDLAAPEVQSSLNDHPRIRATLEASGLGAPDDPIDLDEATVRLGGKVGRPITQAISRVVFTETNGSGIRYTSRLDVSEGCWAVFESTSVSFTDPTGIDLDDADLRSALQTLVLELPP